MKKPKRYLSIALLALITGWHHSPAHAQDTEKTMQVTNIHRAIAAQTGWLNTSRPLTAEELQGRIILLDFWTYCCINCMHVIPDLQFLEEKFGSDLTVIGVHSAKFKNEKDSENIRAAILRYGIHHPVVNDFDFSTWQKFGIRAWPTFVLINPQGTMEAVYSGEGNREEATRDIEKLRQKYAGEINTSPLPVALEKDKAPPTVLSFPGKLSVSNMPSDTPAIAVSDSGHNRILLIDPQGNIITTIGSGKAGFDDGDFAHASFNSPQGVLYFDGVIYVADTNNHALRMIDMQKRGAETVTTIAGTGKQGNVRDAKDAPALSTPLASPWDLEFYPDMDHIAIAMAGTHQLWSYDIEKKTVSVIAGNGRESIDDGRYPFNSLSQPSGLAAAGGKLYFVDSETSSLRVLEKGEIKTLIGTGLFDFGYAEGKQGEALMQHALGVYADDSGVYIADSYNHSIRRYDVKTGVLSNFAGHGVRGKGDGAPLAAEFNEPNDVLKIGDNLYIADTNNNAIRIIDAKGIVSTLAVSEEAEKTAFTTNLPNLEKAPPIAVENGAHVTIALQTGWHINEEAPSSLALFDTSKTPVSVADFTLEQIRKAPLTLPKLEAGKTYQLQGTLYYCEDKAGAQCLIKSFDQTISVKQGGKKEVLFKLN